MKKYIVILMTIFVLTGFSKPAQAAVYNFTPVPNDMFDLDHFYNYVWGINWRPATGEVITQARLFIDNINNWDPENPDDKLYIHLLANAIPNIQGLEQGQDDQGGGDQFANLPPEAQILLDVYSDDNDYPGPAEDYVYYFDATELAFLNKNISDGIVGLGFDPDCHYLNDGVYFQISTGPVVPEPTSMALLGSGLVGLVKFRRKKNA